MESSTEWMSLTNQPMGRAHFIRKVLFSVKLGKRKISRLLSLWASSVGQRWMTTSHVCVHIAHKLVEITPTMQFYILFYLTLLLSIIGEGNGTPLQYSCLENPVDGGAWWAAVHGVATVGHDWVTLLSLFTFMYWRRKWQPTPVFLPGESQGQGGLVGCRLWGSTESDTNEVT